MFLDNVSPFGLSPEAKCEWLGARLYELLERHRAGCPRYERLVADWNRHRGAEHPTLEDYPAIPVSAFKEYDLVSTSAEVMSVKSSATTTGESSRIFVDKGTRKRQTLSALKIWNDFLGVERRPYLVFDQESTVRGSQSMSARGAAILSISHLASSFHFVMKEVDGQLRLDFDALRQALDAIGDAPCISYGFTYILYQAHLEIAASGRPLAGLHPQSVFLHSGGWKRLIDLAVDKPTFNQTVAGAWGLSPTRVIDFYGTVEQVGVFYPDCAAGNKHVPYWADIVIRQSDSFGPAPSGETGLIQLINCLPLSAPNHSVLTEDLGEIVLDDGCSCGRRGRAFVFKGRAPKAQVRGCSDVGRR
jgi:Acyl-protein synthetase, LuxE